MRARGVERWEAHVGLDYAVVMRPGETTDNASVRLADASLAPRIAAVPDMMAALAAIAAGARDMRAAQRMAREALQVAGVNLS